MLTKVPKHYVMLIITAIIFIIAATISLTGCEVQQTGDEKQSKQQESIVDQLRSQIGMPAITNGTDLRLLKMIYEKRDQEGLTTYTYMKNAMTGKLVYQGESVGYGIPGSAQFSAPHKAAWYANKGWILLDQPEPNGIYSPSSMDATWVLMVDPNDHKTIAPVYWEDKVDVFPFKLPE